MVVSPASTVVYILLALIDATYSRCLESTHLSISSSIIIHGLNTMIIQTAIEKDTG